MKRIFTIIIALLLLALPACGQKGEPMSSISTSTEESTISTQPEPTGESSTQSEIQAEPSAEPSAGNEEPPEGFVLITGGTFDMGSPDT